MAAGVLTGRSRSLSPLVVVVRRAVRARGLQNAAADDATQEAIAALARHPERLDAMPQDQRLAYAWTVGMRSAGRVMRKIMRAASAPAGFGPPASSARPDRAASSKETLREVLQTVARLSAKERLAFELVVEQELTMVEASAACDVPRTTLAARLQRVRKAVRRIL